MEPAGGDGGQDVAEAMSWNPLTVLASATRAVPQMKYALAVAGLAAVVSLVVSGFKLSPRVAVIGSLIVLVLMVLLLLFARLAVSHAGVFKLPSQILLWSFLLLTVATMTLLFTGVFFGRPLDLKHWLGGSGTPVTSGHKPVGGERDRPPADRYVFIGLDAPSIRTTDPRRDPAAAPYRIEIVGLGTYPLTRNAILLGRDVPPASVLAEYRRVIGGHQTGPPRSFPDANLPKKEAKVRLQKWSPQEDRYRDCPGVLSFSSDETTWLISTRQCF